MAGLKLKSGADFCNFEAFRMRLHNAGEDPTSDFGVGQIYFNTSDTSVGSAHHVRLYDGTKFRSLAYLDDVDSRIKTIEDMLSVDTAEGVVSTWNEIQEFLDSVQEGTDLMDLLNGKLNTSGGTINGNLLIGAPDNTSYRYLQFARSGYGSRLNIADGNLYVSFGGIDANGGLTATKSLSIGNNGLRFSPDQKTYYDILTSAGGTISGGAKVLTIERDDTSLPSVIAFSNKSGYLGYIGFDGNDSPIIYNADLSTKKKLLHSGNIGSQIVEGINNHSGEALDVQGNIDNLNAYYSNGAFKLTRCKGLSGLGTNNSDGIIANWPLDHKYGQQWYIDDESHTIQVRYVANAVWSDWKTIAFTDSNVASASKLETARTLWGQSFDGTGNVSGHLILNNQSAILSYTTSGTSLELFNISSNNNLSIGYSMAGVGNSYIYGNEIYLRYGSSRTNGLILNSSGNVTIGAEDKAGTSCKLYVDGKLRLPYLYFYNNNIYSDTDGLYIQPYGAGNVNINQLGTNTIINYSGGNVLIGNTQNNGSGAKLQVNGDLHVSGNIIADGEVSAGGRAEEGGNAGSGAGAFYSDIIKKGATQTTIAHGLGTDDIVVSIYEKDGVSGRWSIILTDVEIVDANNIIVSFGSATSVEHKVVIMGAVA